MDHLALNQALAVPDDLSFFNELLRLLRPPGSRLPPLEAQPELVRMLIVLRGLYLSTSVGGLLHFWEDYVSDYYHEAEAWCERIGAHRTVEYLRAGAAYFPDRRVPKDHDERTAIADPLGDREDAPIQALDKEYRTVVGEIAASFRSFVSAHRDEFMAAELPTR